MRLEEDNIQHDLNIDSVYTNTKSSIGNISYQTANNLSLNQETAIQVNFHKNAKSRKNNIHVSKLKESQFKKKIIIIS